MGPGADDLQPVGIVDILEFSFRVYRQRFGTLVRAAAVVVVPVWIFTVLLLSATPLGEAVELLESPPADQVAADPADPFGELEASDFARYVGGVLVVGALGAVSSQMATAVTFLIVVGAYLGITRTWQESVAFAWRRLGPLVWLQLIYSILLSLGFIAFVVPGVYLFVAWTVAVPVLLFRDTSGLGALRRSRELLRGRWWPTAGLLVLVGLVTSLFQALLGKVLPLLARGLGGAVAPNLAEAAAGLIGAVITTPFTAAVITVLFFDALARKEGLGFDDLAGGMGVDPPADPFLGPA